MLPLGDMPLKMLEKKFGKIRNNFKANLHFNNPFLLRLAIPVNYFICVVFNNKVFICHLVLWQGIG